MAAATYVIVKAALAVVCETLMPGIVELPPKVKLAPVTVRLMVSPAPLWLMVAYPLLGVLATILFRMTLAAVLPALEL